MKKHLFAIISIFLIISCKKDDSPKTSTPDSFDFTEFTSESNIQIAQTTVIENGQLIFNKNSESGFGNAIYKKQVSIANGFETTIRFTITGLGGISDNNGELGGDGIAFTLFNSDTTYLTSSAWYYIPNSIGTELDTYYNYDSDDPNGNHLGVYSFDISNVESASKGFSTTIPNVSDGNEHTLKIVYKNHNYSVYMDGSSTPYISIDVDISTLVQLENGKAYVGIAAMAGLSLETHTINSWQFTSYE